MIKTRQEILSINPVFTEHLIRIQEAKYSPVGFEYHEGEKVILDEGLVTLTRERAAQLNQECLQDFETSKDHSPFDRKMSLEWKGRTILVSSKQSVELYLSDIAYALAGLSEHFKNHLFVISDHNTPWLYQQRNYAPVKNALKYLKSMVDVSFNGGFLFSNDELPVFIPHLFWLIRCNASLPTFMISWKDSCTIINLNKYGNLNLEFYDSAEQALLLDFFTKRQFRIIDDYYESIEFDDFRGRKLKI